MAGLFRSETIKRYPVGRGLDTFRKVFSSTSAGLNNQEESLDVVQHLNDEGEISRHARRRI
jgi:hypothetical protein